MKGLAEKYPGRSNAVAVLMFLCSGSIAPAASAQSAAQSAGLTADLTVELPADCAGDLDRAVLMDSNGESEYARRLFEALDSRCQNYPQVAHNLGVIAGREGDWDEALQHFERAIAADKRASMSLEHLRGIHRYRAALAWREALDASLDPAAQAPTPTMSLQDSSWLNSDSSRVTTTSSELRTISTIEYELFDLWQNAAANNRAGWLAHYSRSFTAPEPTVLARFKWDELKLRVSLTQNDAVAIVTYPEPTLAGSLMLLRLEGNRWTIYEQSPL